MSSARAASTCTRTLLYFSLLIFLNLGERVAFAQKTPIVYVAPIEGMIDLGLAPIVERVLREATEA
jgi:membrane-bound ClpP family serine protease